MTQKVEESGTVLFVSFCGVVFSFLFSLLFVVFFPSSLFCLYLPMHLLYRYLPLSLSVSVSLSLSSPFTSTCVCSLSHFRAPCTMYFLSLSLLCVQTLAIGLLASFHKPKPAVSRPIPTIQWRVQRHDQF